MILWLLIGLITDAIFLGMLWADAENDFELSVAAVIVGIGIICLGPIIALFFLADTIYDINKLNNTILIRIKKHD